LSTISSSRRGKKAKKETIDRDKALLITSSVPVEKGFHFFTELKKPLGIFATSIFEFSDQLKKVNATSLEFHMKRNDFARWLRDVIRDDTLANEFDKFQHVEMAGEKLRGKLVEITEKRCKELAEALKGVGS
jgi:uncharacterized protein DUF5752